MVHITKLPCHVVLIGIDIISKTFVILGNGSAGIVGARLFENYQHVWISQILRLMKIICFENVDIHFHTFHIILLF